MNREDPIKTTPESMINGGDLVSVVALVWHEGKVIRHRSLCWRVIETKLPVARDVLLSIASMTKPTTSTVPE